MNALQKRVLELFQAFLQVCQQLDLSYFLVCGSALGAVKYQGFIPWDDDMDLAMLRPDYEVFLAKAQPLLPRHIFLQNYKTDPAFPAIYSKLRLSGTVFLEESAQHLPIHHGIFLDLFPLDGGTLPPAEAGAAKAALPPPPGRCILRPLRSIQMSDSSSGLAPADRRRCRSL